MKKDKMETTTVTDNARYWDKSRREMKDFAACFETLLTMATEQKGKTIKVRGNAVTVKNGEVAVSLRKLCRAFGYAPESKSAVARILIRMEEKGLIRVKRSNIISIVTFIRKRLPKGLASTKNRNSKNDKNHKNNGLGGNSSTVDTERINNEEFNAKSQKQRKKPPHTPLKKKKKYKLLVREAQARASAFYRNIMRFKRDGVETMTPDEIIEILKQAEIWKEITAKNHKLAPDEIPVLLDKFRDFCISYGYWDDREHKSREGIMRHFNNWLWKTKEYRKMDELAAIPLEERRRKFWRKITKAGEKYGNPDLLKEFYAIWSGIVRTGDFMLFETEKSFDVEKKLGLFALKRLGR